MRLCRCIEDLELSVRSRFVVANQLSKRRRFGLPASAVIWWTIALAGPGGGLMYGIPAETVEDHRLGTEAPQFAGLRR